MLCQLGYPGLSYCGVRELLGTCRRNRSGTAVDAGLNFGVAVGAQQDALARLGAE